jgi:hypothetical protein
VTLRPGKINRQTFRCFPSFQQGQGIRQVAIQPIVDNRATLQSFSREIIKAMR